MQSDPHFWHRSDMEDDLMLLDMLKARLMALSKVLKDASENANVGETRKAIDEFRDQIDAIETDTLSAMKAVLNMELDARGPKLTNERQNVDQVSMAGARL